MTSMTLQSLGAAAIMMLIVSRDMILYRSDVCFVLAAASPLHEPLTQGISALSGLKSTSVDAAM